MVVNLEILIIIVILGVVKDVYESKHIFHGASQYLTDIITEVEMNNVYVRIGCGDNFTLTSLSFIHSTDYKIYTTPR